jgi:light-regulated signal transduction histidine kinase (bacteriophytochrome)
LESAGIDRLPVPGLGIKEIVEEHGGEIGVTGEPGDGATFCFTLPMV